ncbi:MAG: DUF6398 domain-containing protein [Candidatus Woesearchaeota archaeon]
MNKEKKEQVERIIFSLDLVYTNEDKKNIQKLIDSYFRKRNIPDSRKENLAGGLLWVYSRINFLFQEDFEWSQKEIAKKIGIESKSISRMSSSLMNKMKIDIFDDRFARKEIIEKNPLNNFFMTKEGFIVDRKFIENQLLDNMRARFGDILDIKPNDEIECINLNDKSNELKHSKNKKLNEFFEKEVKEEK